MADDHIFRVNYSLSFHSVCYSHHVPAAKDKKSLDLSLLYLCLCAAYFKLLCLLSPVLAFHDIGVQIFLSMSY